ncbi:MAG: hypothetical protein II680_07995 [Clostridia bacterium]|nr:hypothetical protein [Clostridia bacterium]
MLLKHRQFDIPPDETILLDKHGKPVLDKDGHPVFIEKSLGSRPIGATDREDDFGELPPDPRNRDNSRLDDLPPSPDLPEKEESGEDAAIVLPDPDDGDKKERGSDPLISLLDEEFNSAPEP